MRQFRPGARWRRAAFQGGADENAAAIRGGYDRGSSACRRREARDTGREPRRSTRRGSWTIQPRCPTTDEQLRGRAQARCSVPARWWRARRVLEPVEANMNRSIDRGARAIPEQKTRGSARRCVYERERGPEVTEAEAYSPRLKPATATGFSVLQRPIRKSPSSRSSSFAPVATSSKRRGQ